ncbi:hypothetical protein EG329_003632 [Mollisiaceae sp. DMI_Dod_QoI]|nr:hypothetical protein EG329_003632 [Helotiales sp. DMI_Dod_QoI]
MPPTMVPEMLPKEKAKVLKPSKAMAAEEARRLTKMRYFKIPTYEKGFVHVTSRVGYKGFLEHVSQINGGLLPFTTRKIVEQAWMDLVNEKYMEWETVHSETGKRFGLEKALAQVEPALYQTFCDPQKKTDQAFRLREANMIFTPIVKKFQHISHPVSHPSRSHRLIILPEPPAIPSGPVKAPLKKSRKKSETLSDEDEDVGNNLDYETSATVETPAKKRKHQPVKDIKARKRIKGPSQNAAKKERSWSVETVEPEDSDFYNAE